MKHVYFLLAVLVFTNTLGAQTNTFPSTGAAGIGTTKPDKSSLLEVKSTSKGVLIPRMTITQRDSIKTPAIGLLIYQTNSSPGFYYYNDSNWAAVSGKNYWSLTGNNGTDTSVNFIGTTDNEPLLFKVNNVKAGFVDSATNTTALGYGTLISNHQLNNTAIGYYALRFNTTGIDNTANGSHTLNNNTTGGYNIANGSYSLFSNTTGYDNAANGVAALYTNTTGHDNIANGDNTLYRNTTGSANTANGSSALYNNTTGYYNTANGSSALYSNTGGAFNTANGVDALYYNTTAIGNTANGYSALYDNNGSDNTATGANALGANGTGNDNVANGSDALFNNRTGNYNTADGDNALFATLASDYNTSIGYRAGGLYNNGYNNVFVGANTDVNAAGYFNVIAIGQATVCTASNQVTMGNSATKSYRAFANWSNISDGRYKKNVKENVPGLAFINKLRPVTYNLNATALDNFFHKNIQLKDSISTEAKAINDKALKEKEQIRYTGFVAQEVEKAANDLNYDFSGVDKAKDANDVYGLRYAEFVVPLVKAVQELSGQNDSLKSEIGNLKSEMEQLKAMIVSNQLAVNSEQLAVVTSASLQQNIPNPFTNTTSIGYSLNQKFTSAQIVITDKTGKTLKALNVSGSGKGTMNVDASTLSSGAYQYSLIVDGKLIDTKQMILIR